MWKKKLFLFVFGALLASSSSVRAQIIAGVDPVEGEGGPDGWTNVLYINEQTPFDFSVGGADEGLATEFNFWVAPDRIFEGIVTPLIVEPLVEAPLFGEDFVVRAIGTTREAGTDWEDQGLHGFAFDDDEQPVVQNGWLAGFMSSDAEGLSLDARSPIPFFESDVEGWETGTSSAGSGYPAVELDGPIQEGQSGTRDDAWGLRHYQFQIVAEIGGGAVRLQPGDANQDLLFDGFDIVQVLQAGKYLTGQPATWGEGDWNGAPGGYPGNPPPGNGLFDQLDIIAALSRYVTNTRGPYAAVRPNGEAADSQTSIVYNVGTGELAVDAPTGTELTSINIDSAAGIFTGNAAENLGGSFDNDADNNIFKATFGGSFGSLSFGNVAQPGLTESLLLDDLSVVGSLQGGGALGDVDLIYIPEPASFVLLALCTLLLFNCPFRKERCRIGRSRIRARVMPTKRPTQTILWAVGLAFVLSGVGHLKGETILIDDFNDGNDDGWMRFSTSENEPWGMGTFDASGLSYHLEGSGDVPMGEQGALFSLWDGSEFAGGSLRATVRADSNTLVYLVMHAQGPIEQFPSSGYVFGANPATGNFFFNRIEDFSLMAQDSFAAESPFLVGEDWIIEAGSHGDQLSMKVWRPGEPEPPSPQWTLANSPSTYGLVGVGAKHWVEQPPALVSAAFEDIFFNFPPPQLSPGDANQDLVFDRLDLVQVLQAGKYLTGEPATWGEGDWDGAPGGSQGNPPPGNGLFDEFDLIRATLNCPHWGCGSPYAALSPTGREADGQTSVGYNANTGEVWVDGPAGTDLTSINIDSAAGIFTADPTQNLSGSFDNDSDNNIFKATFGSSFGTLSFGNVAQAGLAEAFVIGDLSVVGSLAGGGGELGEVDLAYVPEAASCVLLALGALLLVRCRYRRTGIVGQVDSLVAIRSTDSSPDSRTRFGPGLSGIVYLLALTPALGYATNITYVVNPVTMSGGTQVSGTVTTDGTLGSLVPTSIVDYQIEVDYRGASPLTNATYSPVWSYEPASSLRFSHLVATSSSLILEPLSEGTATLEITDGETSHSPNFRTRHDLFWSVPTSPFDSRGSVGAIVGLEGNYALIAYDALYFVDQWSGLPSPLEVATVSAGVMLEAGDADQDLDFDQLDLVKVLEGGKYLTGQPATWGEGDWDGAPRGYPGNPPPGNGLFDQLDIIAALTDNCYFCTAPYNALLPAAREGDWQTSVGYDAKTGEIWVDAPAGTELTSINIDSAAGIFEIIIHYGALIPPTVRSCENLGGSFDNCSTENIFKATFGGSFGSISIGKVAAVGLSQDFVLSDLSVVGSLQGGGGLGDIDLIYVPVPEPSALVLAVIGLLAMILSIRKSNPSPAGYPRR